MYKHQRLLHENAVDLTAIPEPVQRMITQFADNQFDLDESIEESGDPHDTAASTGEILRLRDELRELDRTLYRSIKEFIDHEVDEPLEGAELKEAILADFVKQGLTSPKVSQLRQAGYPLTNMVKINERAGNYRLTKGRYDASCKIITLP